MKKFFKHFGYYISLVAIFVLGFIASVLSYPNLNLEISIIVLTIILYVVWGILHHLQNHKLTTKIAMEYILIGMLGLSIVFFIFMGGIGV